MATRARDPDAVLLQVGLDDNWQKCGSLNGERAFHDADGNPLVNTDTFPNLTAMTDHAHTLGLRCGWYMNNCICAERGFSDPALITKIMEKSAEAVRFALGLPLMMGGQPPSSPSSLPQHLSAP